MGVQDKADDVADKASDLAADVGDQAKDKVDDVADKAKDAADDVSRNAADVADDVSGKVRDVADDVSDKARDAAGKAQRAAGQASDRVEDVVDEVQQGHGVVNRLHRAGLRSEWMYAGAFLSIGASLTSWFVSRSKTGDSKAQSDRWGIFIGHWAPTFMALGVALKLEEKR